MKKKILLISDDIRAYSGVATMARYIVEGTKDVFDWITIGSLAKHPEKGQIVEHNGTKIYAAENFGSIDLVRHILKTEKPDAIMLFTDPRFFGHIWGHEDEIRSKVPIFYYNIWDGGPAPLWNRGAYLSCDHLAAISRQTYALNAHVAPEVPRSYIPHGTDLEVFRPIPDEEARQWFKEKAGFDPGFTVLYVNRNIRRKVPADLVLAVHRLVQKTGDKNITLVMRTEPVDGDGTDIPAVLEGIGFAGRAVFFGALEAEDLNKLYNVADVTVNMSSNEGFGITTIESLAAGTPILVNMTGGLQDQVGLKKAGGFSVGIEDYSPEWYSNADGRYKQMGLWADAVFPKVRTINGSPVTPYVLAEYADPEDITQKLKMFHAESREARKYWGLLGRDYLKEVGMTRQKMSERIADALTKTIDNFTPRPRYRLADISVPDKVKPGHITESEE